MTITLNDTGFPVLDGMRLPFRVIPETEEVEFFDKDRRRSEERGTRFVRLGAKEFIEMLQTAVKNSIP